MSAGREDLKKESAFYAKKVESHLAGKVRAVIEQLTNGFLNAEDDELFDAERIWLFSAHSRREN